MQPPAKLKRHVRRPNRAMPGDRPVLTDPAEAKCAAPKHARFMAGLASRLSELVIAELERGNPTLASLHRTIDPGRNASTFAREFVQAVALGEVASHVLFAGACGALPRTALVPSVTVLVEAMSSHRSSREVVRSLREIALQATRLEPDTSDNRDGIDPLDRYVQEFLQAFDPATRRSHGVYFTPAPVVSFIVESVDHLLRSELGLLDGLADLSTWQEVVRRRPDLTIPPGVSARAPFVQILDPATGTGAFVIATIERVYHTLSVRWKAYGLDDHALAQRWTSYVRADLLPRLHGFELLLAPHTVACLAIEAKLRSTGCELGASDELSIWRADALEPASVAQASEQDTRAARIRSVLPVTVLVGNPPFSGAHCHAGGWIDSLMQDYKSTVRSEERQIQRLSNQYVQFLRFVEWKAQAAGVAAAGLITDRGYLDGVLFRDMRRSLVTHIDPLYLVELGGATTRKIGPGSEDNVFDIQQAVAILVGVVTPSRSCRKGPIRIAHVTGSRQDKFRWLGSESIATANFETLSPEPPHYRLSTRGRSSLPYAAWPSLLDIIGTGDRTVDRRLWYGTGIKTRHDRFVVGLSSQQAVQQVRRLANRCESDAELTRELHLCKTAHFDIQAARSKAQNSVRVLAAQVQSLSWRPMDRRFVVWCREFVCEPKTRTMRHLLQPGNIALAVLRQDRTQGARGVFVARGLVAKDYISNVDDALIWPLYVEGERGIELNIQPGYLDAFSKRTGLIVRDFGVSGDEVEPLDLFGYLYAVLNAPSYRSQNQQALCVDFPRVPLSRSAMLFRTLARAGRQMVALHLLDLPGQACACPEIRPGSMVERVVYDKQRERVFIDATQWAPVPRAAWDYVVGAHQVCHAWLTSRRGYRLGAHDLGHFHHMVQALVATLALATHVDGLIEEHGGWQRAFFDF